MATHKINKFKWCCICCEKEIPFDPNGPGNDNEGLLPNLYGGTIEIHFGFGSKFDQIEDMVSHTDIRIQSAVCDSCFEKKQSLTRKVWVKRVSNLYPNQNSFDWNCTNKEFVVYVPNFGRKHLLIPTLHRLYTSVSKDRYLILVVNDGRHEDLSDLEEKFNLKWFTFDREPIERNGCMIRNFIIKNCMSKWLCTKDPEIICDQDIISKVIDLDDIVYRPWGMNELHLCETQKIVDNPHINLDELKLIREWRVSLGTYQAFHNMCCIRTKRLQEMNGYEEDFKDGYGHEDVSLFDRLKASGVQFVIDKDVITWHIAHPIIQKFLNTINLNGRIYQEKKKDLKIIANENKLWGEGI